MVNANAVRNDAIDQVRRFLIKTLSDDGCFGVDVSDQTFVVRLTAEGDALKLKDALTPEPVPSGQGVDWTFTYVVDNAELSLTLSVKCEPDGPEKRLRRYTHVVPTEESAVVEVSGRMRTDTFGELAIGKRILFDAPIVRVQTGTLEG